MIMDADLINVIILGVGVLLTAMGYQAGRTR